MVKTSDSKKQRGIIYLVNHKETAVVADVVRQFFGNIQPCDNVFTLPSDEDFKIYCKSSHELKPGLMQKLMRHELGSDEAAFLPEEFEISVKLINVRGKRLWRARSKPEDIRRNIRRLMHLALSEQTGLSFPWGTLSGVRPTQLVSKILIKNRLQHSEHGHKRVLFSDEEKIETFEELTNYWRLSPAKAKLALETTLNEISVMEQVDSDAGDYIVYIGLPFCPSRCSYCSFITESAVSQGALLEDYVKAITEEARGVFSQIKRAPRALYFGGGTPSSLAENLFARYLDGIMSVIPINSETELTMEAGRPDTLTSEKLRLIKSAGFQKICINPQTMIDETLHAVGRCHSTEDTLRAVYQARELGFTDINMDLIAGLPGDRADGLSYSLDRVLELAPESITLHTLSVKRGAILDQHGKASNPFLPQLDLIRQVERAHERLRESSYRPYYLYRQKTIRSGLENTGFTKDKPSIYNVAMMSDQVPVIGLGSGATSKRFTSGNLERSYNPKDLKVYIERVDLITAQKNEFFHKQIFLAAAKE